jgi:hypothetical protein
MIVLNVFLALAASVGPAPSPAAPSLAIVRFGGDAAALDAVGGFVTLEGQPLPGRPLRIEVVPGRRRIGYLCHVVLDGPTAVLERVFEAGKAYELHCAPGTEEARVVVK